MQSFHHIRAQLLNFACRLVDDLEPDDPDINLRTLSLSRTLDRIYWLDENLYDGEDEADESDKAAPPNRIESVDDGQASERPPLQDASQEDDG